MKEKYQNINHKEKVLQWKNFFLDTAKIKIMKMKINYYLGKELTKI